jgi:hypothetical protein
MQRILRWLIFIGVVITLALALLSAPANIAPIVFGVIVVIALVLAILQGRGVRLQDMRWARLQQAWHNFQKQSLIYKQKTWVRHLARVSALFALLAVLRAWVHFFPYNYYQTAMAGWNDVLLAFLLALLPLWVFLSPDVVTPAPTKRLPAPDVRMPRWRVLLFGLLCWLILVQTTLIRPFDEGTLPHHLQAILFVVGVAGMVIGWGAWRWHISIWDALRPRKAWLPIGIVIAIGAFVRLYDLEYGIHRFVDEVHFLYAVSRLWYAGDQALLMPHGGTTAFTWLYPYVQSLTSALVGPSLNGLRLASVGFGVVQIWAAYELGKHLLNRRAGLFMALAIATFPPHVHFSRLGINNIADPTFALLAFAFFVRGMRRHRQIDFALAGAMLGLTTYFYEGGRLFYAPFMVLWLLWMAFFLRRERGFRLPDVRHWLIFFVTAGTLIGGFYYVWVTNFVTLLPRYESVGGNLDGVLADLATGEPLRVLWQYLHPPLLSILHYPSLDSFYHGDQPFVPWLMVPFLLVGVLVSLYRVRRPDGALIFWWVIGGASANMFMGAIAQSPRYVVVFPALALAIGMGAYWIALWLGRMAHWRTKTTRIVGALLIGAICTYQMVYYLGEFLPMYYERQFYDEFVNGIRVRDTDDVLFRAMTLPEDVHVHIIQRDFFGAAGYGAVMTYYGRHRDMHLETFVPEEITPEYLLTLTPMHTYAFFIEPEDNDTYQMLAEYFDLVGPEFSPYDIPPERQMALYMAYPTSRTLNDPRRWDFQQERLQGNG